MNNGFDEPDQEDSAITSPPPLTPDNLEPVAGELDNLVQLASEKRNAFLRELQTGLDMLVYIELSCVYYTESVVYPWFPTPHFQADLNSLTAVPHSVSCFAQPSSSRT